MQHVNSGYAVSDWGQKDFSMIFDGNIVNIFAI